MLSSRHLARDALEYRTCRCLRASSCHDEPDRGLNFLEDFVVAVDDNRLSIGNS